MAAQIWAFLILFVIALSIIALLLYMMYKLFFLRNPSRTSPSGNNIVAPADGKIIEIISVNSSKKKSVRKGIGTINTITGDVGDKTLLISIFMSPLNVHYQRAPIDGTVVSVRHSKGKFMAANKLALENEKNEVLLNTAMGKIKVIQIAGFLVRRIECFAKRGQALKKGDLLGVVKLGSQVCIILPQKVKLKIKNGDKVYAGETVIAEY